MTSAFGSEVAKQHKIVKNAKPSCLQTQPFITLLSHT